MENMVRLCCGWRHLREWFQTGVLRFLGPFLTATNFGKDVSKLAAIFIAGFNFVTLLVTLGLQCIDQLSVRCSHLPKNTLLEQDELRVSPWPLETWVGCFGRVTHGARESRCGLCGLCGWQRGGAAARKGAVSHSRGLRPSPRPREEEREVRVRSLYYVV